MPLPWLLFAAALPVPQHRPISYTVHLQEVYTIEYVLCLWCSVEVLAAVGASAAPLAVYALTVHDTAISTQLTEMHA